MDPSQKAAEPIKQLSVAELASMGKAAERVKESATAQENRQLAAQELAMIFELKENRPYKWFEAEFIDKPFQEAREKLRSPETKPEELPVAHQRYLALKEVKAGMLEREIGWRKALDRTDSEIARLQMKLDAL